MAGAGAPGLGKPAGRPGPVPLWPGHHGRRRRQGGFLGRTAGAGDRRHHRRGGGRRLRRPPDGDGDAASRPIRRPGGLGGHGGHPSRLPPHGRRQGRERRKGASSGRGEAVQGRAEKAVRPLRHRPGGASGGSGGHGSGHAGPGGSDRRLHPPLSIGEGPPQRHGLLRPGALRHRAAADRRRPAHRPGPSGGGPVPGDHGGRVSGRQRCPELHLHRRLPPGAESLHRGRREAEHLPLPPGRPHHLPTEV